MRLKPRSARVNQSIRYGPRFQIFWMRCGICRLQPLNRRAMPPQLLTVDGGNCLRRGSRAAFGGAISRRAMRFPPSFLDEIRDRVPISSVIGPRVSWDRRKTNAQRGDWWACCPFHGEKSPSFHCEDKKGRYHCFGCGASGDHFRFLTENDGLSFPEAVERIAELAGVPMP